MKLSAQLIEAFSGTFLSPRYDSPQPTPDFHRQGWELYASDAPQVMLAAPRNHAKSTSFTHDFILATVLFRVEPYVILVGSSEEMTIEHLQDIASELQENEDLIREFGIKGFLTNQKTDIIVECTDGYKFRIIARGSEQKIRGRKWNGRRPGLIVCDDMEDDEQVENRDRRLKFSRWFFRAAKQALRDGGRIRVHGTILHEDSLLARLSKNRAWKHMIFRAHQSFDDFSNILWPEKFSEARLRNIRQEFIDNGDSSGYSQEYLNDPFDNDERFFNSQHFLPMSERDFEAHKLICAAADFAVSTRESADNTSFSVGGLDITNLLHIVDQRVGRWDTEAWIEELFSIQDAWSPDIFFVEDGVIWKSVWPMIRTQMQLRGIYINFVPVPSTKDKAIRARSLQRRMKANGVRFNTLADWFESLKNEMLRFTGRGQAVKDDQVDSMALLSRGFDTLVEVKKEDFYSEEEQEFEDHGRSVKQVGRSAVTGY